MASNNTLTFSDATWETDVLKADKPVLVDFWAQWCPPCRAIGPSIDALAAENGGKAVVGKLNVDENPGTMTRYGVRSIPTLLLFQNGEVVAQTVGAASKADLQKMIDSHAG